MNGGKRAYCLYKRHRFSFLWFSFSYHSCIWPPPPLPLIRFMDQNVRADCCRTHQLFNHVNPFGLRKMVETTGVQPNPIIWTPKAFAMSWQDSIRHNWSRKSTNKFYSLCRLLMCLQKKDYLAAIGPASHHPPSLRRDKRMCPCAVLVSLLGDSSSGQFFF